jgi:hypothetical protein
MEVYDTLAIALPIMGLLAFACAQIVSILILRRRFIPRQSLSALQRRLHLGLSLALLFFAALWAYVFYICIRAVIRDMAVGNWLPLPVFIGLVAIAFACLITVSWFSIRHRTKDLRRLSAELQALSGENPQSTAAPSSLSPLPGQERPKAEKARHAVLYLGAADYRTALDKLEKAGVGSP